MAQCVDAALGSGRKVWQQHSVDDVQHHGAGLHGAPHHRGGTSAVRDDGDGLARNLDLQQSAAAPPTYMSSGTAARRTRRRV